MSFPHAPVTSALETDDPPESLGDGLPDDVKLGKKERKRLFDATRTLDGWERYRALIDASDEAYQLIDIANREARFALIVMGALNAVPLMLASRSDVTTALTNSERYWLAAFFLGYGVLVLTFILQAIEALRPGRFRPSLANWPAGANDFPIGVRYYEDIVQRTTVEHWAAWRHVRLTQLNAELAAQVHSLALKNEAKHRAIRQLYDGLRIMALALGALVSLFVFLAWT